MTDSASGGGGVVLIVPAAPLLLPGRSRTVPDGVLEVLAACDAVLAPAVRGCPEVAVVGAPDLLRDVDPVPPDDVEPRSWQVATTLLDRVGYDGVRLKGTPADPPRAAGVTMYLADGSASVGAGAPRPGGSGAEFDERLTDVLTGGRLPELATVTDTDAYAVGCMTAAVWRALAERGRAEVISMQSFAPYGVRYFVGSATVG